MSSDEKKNEFVEGNVALQWENSLEHLKILGYEQSFVQKQHRKPFDRVYFTLPAKNLSKQFDDFIQLCCWLLDEISPSSGILRIEEYDDPGTIANKLLLVLRQVGFNVSFSVQKLRTPYGDVVCEVLGFLTDKALESQHFQWKKPDFGHLNQLDETGNNNDDEVDDIEDNLSVSDNENDMISGTHSTNLNTMENDVNQSGNGQDARSLPAQVVTRPSLVDVNEWRTEVERVAPKLRSSQRRINSEWRQRVEQATSSANKVETTLTLAQADLTALSRSLADDLSRLSRRENHLNQQFPTASHQFKDVKVRLDDLTHKTKTSSDVIKSLTTEMTELDEQIDELTAILESGESGGGHDSSPLLRIKAALKQLKSEISDFDLRTGVVSHSLLSAKHENVKANRAQMMKKNRLKNRKTNNKTGDFNQPFDISTDEHRTQRFIGSL